MLCAFEESREQLFRNARGWGADFEGLEESGVLRVVCSRPGTAGIEDHLIRIRAEIEEFQPDRFALDSLSAVERVSSERGFRQFVLGLTSHLKARRITGLYTATTPTLLGGESVTVSHISTLTDSIILLRYVEILGSIRRGIAVLKMRGSTHDKDIRELMIDGTGMSVADPFRDVGGILAGSPVTHGATELERLQRIFDGN